MEQPLESNTGTQPVQSQTNAQVMDNMPDKMDTTTQQNEAGVQTAETPTTVTVTQSVGKEPAPSHHMDHTGETVKDSSAPVESIPATNPKPGSGVQQATKQDKGLKKYTPSKKAMIDPLKIDMSKAVVMPLTSSQLSLQCIECHIIFSDHKSKERHLKLSHPAEYEQCILRNALFACYVCDRHFTNSTELMAHQKAHIEKKPFKCPICGQAFKKSSELTQHKKVHFGQNGYACTDCGKPCKTLTLLKYHRRTHTGERPYVCKECGKRFSMPKALQKHAVSHLPEGAEEDGGDTNVKAQPKKKDGVSTIKYPCSICKAMFKTTKTRLQHMKNKHNMVPAGATTNAIPAGQQLKQITPIITPISICQSALLQVEPNGPLQKVDANIDTEQIRKLIESLGNVQKVNQVVILGQVPLHAPPLEVQRVSEPAGPLHLNLNPQQYDFIELKQTESKIVGLGPSDDPMEQTIILEPITPDGQLENPSFSQLAAQSNITTAENMGLTPVEIEQTQRQEGQKVTHQIIQQPEINTSIIQLEPLDQMVCQSKQNLDQTVILEFTSTLMPTMELEQSQIVSENEVPSSSMVPVTGLEITSEETVIAERETGLSVPPLMPIVEMELTPLQTHQQDLPACPFVPPETLTQTADGCETNPKGEGDSQVETVNLDQADRVHSVIDGVVKESNKKTEQPSEKLLVDIGETWEQLEKLPEAEGSSAKHLETKELQETSGLPINVMSAQELVKVRKRKPARTFFFQGHIQELVGTLEQDDFQIDGKPAKRQRTRKSHLVVKFSPQNKERKNKKQKQPSQQHQSTQEEAIRGKTETTNLSEKKMSPPKKGRMGKKGKKVGQPLSVDKLKSSCRSQDQQVQQIKEDTKKAKMKKQKDLVSDSVKPATEETTQTAGLFKKKKQPKPIEKKQTKKAKDAKMTIKNQAKGLGKEQKLSTKTKTTFTNITQETLLLLKGHKQPLLKVHKLDPTKASGQTPEASPDNSPTSMKQNKDGTLKQRKDSTKKSANNRKTEGKKKGGRPKKNQKSLSLLSSLQVSHQPSETPIKPKTTRKRKAPANVETEGVITSAHSRRALECKDCGERFTEVASLQKHKAQVHIVESPGLTYTNGNIFEGVSSLDLFQLPKQHEKVTGVMNAAADWDTEPEMAEISLEDKEQSVSFPALNPSPSLPVPPSDVDRGYGDVAGNKTVSDGQSLNSPDIVLPCQQVKILKSNKESSTCVTSENPLNTSTETKSSEEDESLASAQGETSQPSIKDLSKTPALASMQSEVQDTADEDIKEDLLLKIVTVGEQSDRDDPTLSLDNVSENERNGSTNPEGESNDTAIVTVQNDHKRTEESPSLQTVSCSTHQQDIKEEEEETVVQKKKVVKGTVTRWATRGRRGGAGRQKRSALCKSNSVEVNTRETVQEKEQGECQVVHQKAASDSEMIFECETHTDRHDKPTSQSSPAENTTAKFDANEGTLSDSPVERVVCELESVTTSVEQVARSDDSRMERAEDPERETDQSPGIILDRIISSQRRDTNKELSLILTRSPRQGLDDTAESEAEVQEIKVEENTLDPLHLLVTLDCESRQGSSIQPQHRHGIRTVLVKDESSPMSDEAEATQGNRHIRWSVEQINTENSSSPLMEIGENTTDSNMVADFNANQCVFYPVKEEEREVLLGATPSNTLLPDGISSDAQIGLQSNDEGSYATQDYQETRVSGEGHQEFAEAHEADSEWHHAAGIQDFLLQSSDEEDLSGSELPDPQLESEAEVMAYFYKNQTNCPQQPDATCHNLPTSANELHSQIPSEDKRSREPIDYFSNYFGWDTWVEIARCTNKQPNTPVAARVVAQFVGIHIAMGTLKFPSLRLYWEDLTKVPLIAEAMPLSQFLQLSRALKFASPTVCPGKDNSREERQDFQSVQEATPGTVSFSNRSSSLINEAQRQGDKSNDQNCPNVHTDPLWKVQPLLCRFRAGCQSLRQDAEYAVDQYPLPLTGKTNNNKRSLYCTTLIGFGGLMMHVDLKLNLLDKEDAVEKMAPRGSMVFLCRQELSTPAMLERLLVAGVHGAGRVGGARGQIGDEFVSSDGRLMLRRSQCGFILSTAGNSQKNMPSLIDNFEKAQMLTRLNRDLQNLYRIPLTALAPTCWPQAVLWYLTDTALVNSWLLYRQDHQSVSEPLTLMAFRLEVSKALIRCSGSDTQDSVPPQPPTEKAHVTSETPNPNVIQESPLPDAATRYDGSGHWPEQLAEGEGGRCRFGDCQRTSRVLCLKCCVFLCISRNHNCFLNFHNQGSSGNM
ncbi:zinc finger protein 576, tandem duplicate 1 isoform X2 [Genypterus blacodes]|uniref:zinc finger protein 576, tandem duplicate 1 isoform X2 n=1 Tax=Genypterus blacodes TaxID=154954 RepID=UPI003F763D75